MALWLERRAWPRGGAEWEEQVSGERGEDAIPPEETDGPVTHPEVHERAPPLEMPSHPLWVCRLSNCQRSFVGHAVLQVKGARDSAVSEKTDKRCSLWYKTFPLNIAAQFAMNWLTHPSAPVATSEKR